MKQNPYSGAKSHSDSQEILTTTNTCWEATQRVMAARLTRL